MMNLYTIQARSVDGKGSMMLQRGIKGLGIAVNLADKIKSIASDDFEIVLLTEEFERIATTPRIIG